MAAGHHAGQPVLAIVSAGLLGFQNLQETIQSPANEERAATHLFVCPLRSLLPRIAYCQPQRPTHHS